MRKIKLDLRHEFTHEELDQKRDELADVTLRQGELKIQAKAAAAALKEQIEILDGRRRHLARQIQAKGEDRPTYCVVKFNSPRPKLKTTIRLDTGEVVREGEAMDRDEWQEHLFKDAEIVELEKIYGGDGPVEAEELPLIAPAPIDGKSAAAGESNVTEITPAPESDDSEVAS